MTANGVYDYDARSIETQKQRYSRELAAYTLQQWDTARRAMESAKAESMSSSRSGAPKDSGKSSRTSQGIQLIDYAPKSRNGVKHEGRAVAAGNT